MKNLYLFIIFILCPIFAYGASVCVPPNMYVAVLVPESDGVSSTYDNSGNWTVTFDYTTAGVNSATTSNVAGVSSCNEIPGTVNSAAGYISASSSDTGKYCWCEMVKPLVSEWVFAYEYADDSTCASSCTAKCANVVETVSAFRTAMYGNIW